MDHIVTKRRYKFKRPFGLPVRFHDYQTLISKTNPDFIEFHLSYNDLDADWRNFFRETTRYRISGSQSRFIQR